ncbi:F0F1 ATP synthase subunit delta [Xanthobacter versatilis]|uniref:ATP synthase subunit delta n=1 Tax=Xanthobacter autotrophicus (strain ATCC BAA-1158 / Py2) TaxID=78245 RepID=ATPD_XANP2|nr:RecName: Full=ATP synthase subunit delta; AltName: Full=ATP synthase F(1) sector subunit delta; AltName: Full=F-type ATPase subunit delta; Short=F-ATPase subunit delta [Xanthobacter autotrophicus Py2]ABS67321.1 ATP synthase F1, delta subunit [Xanthobacter autotrophicus Py2]
MAAQGARHGLQVRERCGVADTIVSGMAGRYATALFELATEAGAVDSVKADLDRLSALIAESADLARLVKSPVFSAEEQLKAISAVLDQAGISGLAGNFVRRVAQNRRLFALPRMVADYASLVAAMRGETTAQVTVPAPLSDAHFFALKDALAQQTGKDVILDVTVDPSILGGLIVKLGSRMVDASLKTKLNSIRHAMKEVR